MKDFIKKLTSTGWAGAIGLIIFLIILNGTLMEWTAVKFPTVYHQTGWQFVGMIMMMLYIIPASLLASLLITGLISLWRKQKLKAELFFWTAVTTAVVLLLVWQGPIWIKNFERITEVYVLPENLEEQRGCVIRGSRTIEEKDGLHYVSYSSACRQAIGELFTGVQLVYQPNVTKILQKMIIEKNTYEAGVLLKSESSSFCGDVITEGLFESKCEDDHVKGTVKNNKLEGTWLRFHENGNIQIKANYKDGKLVGSKEYFSHENGQLEEKGNFKDGNYQKEGLWEFYHENGQLKETGNYQDNKQDGLWEFYRENGNIWERVTYRNDLMHGTHETFYDSGEINWKRNYKDGELDGRWESFFKDGKTNILSNWKNGIELNQTRFKYYESGQLETKINYKDEKQYGLAEMYYENGNLQRRGNYKDGKQDGLWKRFDREGNLIETKEF
jgi:antitoxin component YwqK of YwqJK toxin-antitoxin module